MLRRFSCLVVLVMLGVLGLVSPGRVVSGKEPAEPKAADKPEPKWTELFNGKTLHGWKATMFGGAGPVEVEEGKLLLSLTDGLTGVTIDTEVHKDLPKLDYEISLEAMRVEGNDFFCGLTFPVGEDPCSLIVGGWGGPVVGLSSLDGKDAARNDTTKLIKFKTGQWYQIRLKVTKEKIEAWIDKDQVIEAKIAARKVSIRPEMALSKPFGLASWNTTAALRNIKIRSLK